MNQPTLKRAISLPLITLYGVGTILGAGIYVLTGRIAAHSGLYAPVAFLIAALVAAFSALSYAELSSRLPRSGGEAVYVQTAFRSGTLAALVGWAIVATGIVSAATIANGFVGYLQILVPLPDAAALIAVVGSIGLIALWGVVESVGIAVAITLVELIGVGLVLFFAGGSLGQFPERWSELLPLADPEVWWGIGTAAFLAFYAYIGFEDMVNMAEEVHEPRRNLPLAIIIALLLTTVLYVLVALCAVLSLPLQELAASAAPFALIIERNSDFPVTVISAISIVAVGNGALVQVIMGSRVLYGMARQGVAPAALGKINATTRTPVTATLLITALVLLFALALPLETLARATSFIILCVFALVNLSLLTIRVRERGTPPEAPTRAEVRFPLVVPLLGFVLCLGALLFQILR